MNSRKSRTSDDPSQRQKIPNPRPVSSGEDLERSKQATRKYILDEFLDPALNQLQKEDFGPYSGIEPVYKALRLAYTNLCEYRDAQVLNKNQFFQEVQNVSSQGQSQVSNFMSELNMHTGEMVAVRHVQAKLDEFTNTLQPILPVMSRFPPKKFAADRDAYVKKKKFDGPN